MPNSLGLRLLLITSVLLLPTIVVAQCRPYGTSAFRSPVTVAPGLAAYPIFSNLTTPRGIAFDGAGNLLVIERGLGVTAFTEDDPACAGWLRTVVIASANFTQGIQVDDATLYVSTSGQVIKYAYNTTTRTVSGVPTVVVSGIPANGGEYSAFRLITSSLQP
jgi:glucose/arabinose dehydrogenase